jgi:CO/xanthine dehydrogenase FAD-binding subunit
MRASVPGYELIAPRSLDHALDLLPAYRPIAGATDVMVLFEAGKLEHREWMTIRHLKELRGIDAAPEFVTLGALTTYTEVRGDALLAAEFPMLAEAAALTGGIATQNRGTIGGNIVNASPAADTPPALLVYDSEVELVSARGSRWIPYAQFHAGYKRMDLAPDELLARVRLPRGAEISRQRYRKVGTRRAQAISKVCFAGAIVGKQVRIGLGSVAPVPLLVDGDRSTIQQKLEQAISPIDDIRSTSAYRRTVAMNLLNEFLR